MKLPYDAQISWNNIFPVSSQWIYLTIYFFLWPLYIFLTIHFNLHEERCRPHFSKYCKSYFLTTPINGFTYIMLEAAVLSFPSYSCSEHHSVNELVCELRPLIDNFAKRFHQRYLKEICLCNLYLFCLLLISPGVTI